MSRKERFQAVFTELKGILSQYADRFHVKTDEPDSYYLEIDTGEERKPADFFAAVQIRKRYVSYYFMPVYLYPDLLDDLPEELEKRRHGKQCFNFTKVDEPVFDELATLTASGFRRYQAEGLLPA